MIFQLLVLGGGMSEQGPAGQHQVRPGHIEGGINQEILLLPAEGGNRLSSHPCRNTGKHPQLLYPLHARAFSSGVLKSSASPV